MWLGSWKTRLDKPYNFKWPQEPVRSLGIYFSYNLERANIRNFEDRVTALGKTANGWTRRKLTLIGRINIMKTLGLSKLIYSTSVLTTPANLAEKINKFTFSFTWEGKAKGKIIIANKKQGGLRMLDFAILDKALKISWV